MRKSLILSFLLTAVVSLARAQQCTTSVTVNAFDAKSKAAIHGLTSRDFAATVKQRALQVVSVAPVFRNRVLVLVQLDPENTQALRAIADFVREAPPGMPVAFGVFAEHAVITPDFIADTDLLSAAIDDVVSRSAHLGSHSDPEKSLHQALTLFGEHRPGDTILLVSSRRTHLSKHQMQTLREEFRRRGARLQLLTGQPPAMRIQGSPASQIFSQWNMAESIDDQMIALARSTGGVLMGFMNSEWTDAATSGYLLSLSMPASFRNPGSWRLMIRDAGNDVPPADLFYPDQLAPCTLTQVAAVARKTKPRP